MIKVQLKPIFACTAHKAHTCTLHKTFHIVLGVGSLVITKFRYYFIELSIIYTFVPANYLKVTIFMYLFS